MKYPLTIFLLMLALGAGGTSCSTDDPVQPVTERPAPPAGPGEPGGNKDPGDPGNNDNNNPGDNNPMNNKIKISIGPASFHVTLENNATAAAFKALLPITISMSEMNGNEKYYYLPENLPAAPSNPGIIHAGDLMLYGSSCIVLFYVTFRTSYIYTRLGRVDNPSELASVLGPGSATVTFELP